MDAEKIIRDVNVFILDKNNRRITSNLDIAKLIIEILAGAYPDQGDSNLSYHLCINAGVIISNKTVAITSLNGFIERDPYTGENIIYVNEDLSFTGFTIENEDNNLDQGDDLPSNLLSLLCSKVNQQFKAFTPAQHGAISKAFDIKANGNIIQLFQPEVVETIGVIAALDSFMLDDSKDWFYFSEITVDNAYKAIANGIRSLIVDTDLKDSLQQLLSENNAVFTDLAILTIIYPLLLKSEQNVDLIQACLTILMKQDTPYHPLFTVYELAPGIFNKYTEIYILLPHMKPVLNLLNEIDLSFK
ncbi:TPA: hypothetical protein MW242_002622 [Acinetobacter baumannii]|nr:hypothetical protein [Acinetobacter baumannii]